MVDPMQAQGLAHQTFIDLVLTPLNAGHIADPAQQTVGDPRRAAATARNATAGPSGEGHSEQISGSRHDRLQILLAVELKPLDQAETVAQR